MLPDAISSSAGSPSMAMPAMIASLIESAAVYLETDREASRNYLLRAYALLRVQPRNSKVPALDGTRGRLATWQAKRVIGYIDENLGSSIRTSDLAGVVNLSTSHFSRAFKISTGMPPSEYIAQRRVARAREMMSTTDESLSQVALECGLNDQSSFCRVFRRIVGQSPSEWRRTNATGPSTKRNAGTACARHEHPDGTVWAASAVDKPQRVLPYLPKT